MAVVTCDFVLDPELLAFKFMNTQVVGMRPLVFLVNCMVDSRVLGKQ